MSRVGVEVPVIGYEATVVLGHTWYQRAGKRVFDTVLALGLLLAVAPLIIVLLGLATISTGQSPIFRQERVGLGGDRFVMFKVRTMRGAPTKVQGDGLGRWREFVEDGQARVTPVGRIMRALSLDELPQLWNVLRGDMALVGPRPEMPEIAATWKPWQYQRVHVRPGLTGPWQVSPHRNEPIASHIEYDLDYVAQVSLWRDLELLARTPAAIVGLGSSRRGH